MMKYEWMILGKFDHDRSLFSRSLEWWIREMIPIHGRKIQVSEILYTSPRYHELSRSGPPAMIAQPAVANQTWLAGKAII